jgi:hypothetical protein
VENGIVRKDGPFQEHSNVYGRKSGTVRKEGPFLGPMCFPHRREILILGIGERWKPTHFNPEHGGRMFISDLKCQYLFTRLQGSNL